MALPVLDAQAIGRLRLQRMVGRVFCAVEVAAALAFATALALGSVDGARPILVVVLVLNVLGAGLGAVQARASTQKLRTASQAP